MLHGDGLGRSAEERRCQGAQVAVGETDGQEPEDAQGGQQRVDSQVAQSPARGCERRPRR